MTTEFWTAVSFLCLGFVVFTFLAVKGVPGYIREHRKHSIYAETLEYGMMSTLGVLGLIGVLCGAGFGLYPYKAEYHSWREHHGTVTQVSSRIVGGDSVNQKFVVQFRGSPQLYGVNDTRAATLKKGDKLSIVCIRTHQWGGGVDGYDCRWNQ